jgi:hypothetical protein
MEVKGWFFWMDGKRRIPIVNIPRRILVVLRKKHGKVGEKAGAGTQECSPTFASYLLFHAFFPDFI